MITADLGGKRALVTGGASGIGLATVELFARSGARVAMNDVPGNPNLAREVERLQGEGLAVMAAPGDVGDGDDARSMVGRAAEAMGGLDYLVNNAGVALTKNAIPPGDLDALDEGFWRRMLDVNLIGAFRCIHAAAPHLKSARGAVVNTASTAGFLSGGGSSTAYAASKAALIKMTKDLARGLAPEVRVNAIAPRMVDTPWECRFDDTVGPDGTPLEPMPGVPLARIGKPEDFAEAILFLSAGAGYITGQTLRVDGGWQ